MAIIVSVLVVVVVQIVEFVIQIVEFVVHIFEVLAQIFEVAQKPSQAPSHEADDTDIERVFDELESTLFKTPVRIPLPPSGSSTSCSSIMYSPLVFAWHYFFSKLNKLSCITICFENLKIYV